MHGGAALLIGLLGAKLECSAVLADHHPHLFGDPAFHVWVNLEGNRKLSAYQASEMLNDFFGTRPASRLIRVGSKAMVP